MSTISGATIPVNFSTSPGYQQTLTTAFSSVTQVTTVSTSGVSTVSGGVVLGTQNVSVTVSGSAIADTSGGGNSITTMNPASVFAQGGDTVSSTAATTVLGGDSGTTTFALSGSNSSVTGGAGYLAGSASSANSTLVGGTGGGSLTVGGGGTGSVVVAGQGTGTTTVTLAETTGGAEVATNPLGDAGTLVATLSSTGADSVVGGGGASTITGGGGHDVFDFVNGHAGGTEVIIGYTASDNIAFGGYGYSATNLPTENLVGSNDVITLSDGTVITLVNLGHKLFS